MTVSISNKADNLTFIGEDIERDQKRNVYVSTSCVVILCYLGVKVHNSGTLYSLQ